MRPGRAVLDTLSLPYRLGFWLWKTLAVHKKRPHIPAYTISVGNLTVGGSGKTPFVIEFAKELIEKGVKLAVLSRGYRRKSRGLVAAPPGSAANPLELGDEPALIYRKLGGKVPVVVDKNRFRGGVYAVENYDVEAVLLDDGFQYLQILHDYVILIINIDDINGGALLPFGRFREPITATKRADLIVVNYRDREFDGREFDFGITPYIRMRYTLNIPVEPGTKVFVFAGTAKPDEFVRMLAQAGIEVVGYKKFRDHSWYSPKRIKKLIRKAENAGADVILTTEKDYVRISEPPEILKPVELVPEIEDLDHIVSVIASKILSFRKNET